MPEQKIPNPEALKNAIDLEAIAPHVQIGTAENPDGMYPAARMKPETYPGDAPEGTGFMVVGDQLFGLQYNEGDALEGEFDPQITTNEGTLSLDEYLTSKNLPGMSQRYPVVSFGSNRCPGQLENKFKPGVTEASEDDMTTVPAFKARFKGADVVHTEKPGMLGYSYAELFISPDTAETEVDVTVTFLTEAQLKVMHPTEASYQLAEHGEVQIGVGVDDDAEGFSVPAIFYAGNAKVGMQEGSVQAMAEIKAKNRTLPEKDQKQAVVDFFAYDPTSEKAEIVVAMEAALAEYPADDFDPSKKESMSSKDWAEYVYRRAMRSQDAGSTVPLEVKREIKGAIGESMGPEESLDVSPAEGVDTIHEQRMTVIKTLGESALGLPAGALEWGPRATNNRFRGTEDLPEDMVRDRIIPHMIEKDGVE